MIQPVNGDPFIGMLETPVTSSPLVAGFLSNLPAYRCAETERASAGRGTCRGTSGAGWARVRPQRQQR